MLKLMLLLGMVAAAWSVCTESPCLETVALVDGEEVDARVLNAASSAPTDTNTAGVFGAAGAAGPGGFLESHQEEAAIKAAVAEDEQDAAKRIAGPPYNPQYVDTCPEVYHTNKVWWVKDLFGRWVALVHNVNNDQFIHWVSCLNRSCSDPIIEGNCVTRSKYHRALVWKKECRRFHCKWVPKFVWIRLPGSCECEAKLFPDVPW